MGISHPCGMIFVKIMHIGSAGGHKPHSDPSCVTPVKKGKRVSQLYPQEPHGCGDRAKQDHKQYDGGQVPYKKGICPLAPESG